MTCSLCTSEFDNHAAMVAHRWFIHEDIPSTHLDGCTRGITGTCDCTLYVSKRKPGQTPLSNRANCSIFIKIEHRVSPLNGPPQSAQEIRKIVRQKVISPQEREKIDFYLAELMRRKAIWS